MSDTAFLKRADGIDAWLAENAPTIKEDQKHIEAGTVERAYWHYGYMMALRDVLAKRAN